MPRKPRRLQWTEAACYHLINRGHNRECVFADDEDRRYFLGLLARYRQRYDLRLYYYCLMRNHFHVLARVRDCRHLSEPGCAVIAAATEGSLATQRLESYRKLQQERAFQATQQDERARLEVKRQGKIGAKALRNRLKEKDGRC